jgi:hypothetical protein
VIGRSDETAPWLLSAVRDFAPDLSDETVALRLGVHEEVVRQARAALAAETKRKEAA